ncbi:hypothetical protein KC19_VG191700 [Ceratodon purpureus]|uniref:Uncharacterized protein n=1 Tax=Ceratodon purpureus TaxID=3225 RepID=A0A8T0HSR4_CERPU|nr:hypothetical protein KC19_VG191700 [Ceratodon purpureus]
MESVEISTALGLHSRVYVLQALTQTFMLTPTWFMHMQWLVICAEQLLEYRRWKLRVSFQTQPRLA